MSISQLSEEAILSRTVEVIDHEEALKRLRQEVNRAGGTVAFSVDKGVDQPNVSSTLTGKRPMSASIAKAIGLKPVIGFEACHDADA
jgi:hypothetical protein